MPSDSHTAWKKKIVGRHPSDDGFLSHWDFKKSDGKPYFTLDPNNIPAEWLDLSEPGKVFEVPEAWYGVERSIHPDFDYLPWHEVDFCRKVWEKYSEKPVKSVLEVCCGICPHGTILSRQGILVTGVDESEGMVKAVEQRAVSGNLRLKAYKRDIFQFSIPGESPDAAILLGNSFPLSRNKKTDNAALVSQLRSVGTFLKKGTIYIIDCGNPEPHPFISEYSMSHPWTVDIGFAKITLTTRTFPTDMETLATPYTVGYDLHYPCGTVRLEYKGAHSFISAQHLSALVEMSRVFKLEAFHHWGNPEPGLTRGGGSYVAILRRL